MVSNKAVRQALYQKLNVSSVTSLLGGGSASLVHGIAPPEATYPLCLFTKQSDTSAHVMGGNAMDNQIWLVKGIVRSSTPSVAEDIDAAVRALLDFGSLTITGGTNLFLARMSGISYVEVDGDTTYQHVGGLYRLSVSV